MYACSYTKEIGKARKSQKGVRDNTRLFIKQEFVSQKRLDGDEMRIAKVVSYLTISLLILIFLFLVVSIGSNTSFITIISQFIKYLGKGAGDIFFTPYSLLMLVFIIALSNPNSFVDFLRNISDHVEEIWGVKLKRVEPEKPQSMEELMGPISSNAGGIEQSNRDDVRFFKTLLTRMDGMATCRFLLYAINQPGRPANFSLKELIGWTYGKEAAEILESQSYINTLSYPASVLIQTGAITGSLNINPGSITFENIKVAPTAHVALEQLYREGFQMTPQVEYDRES